MKIKRNDDTLAGVKSMLTWREISREVIAPVWTAANGTAYGTAVLLNPDGSYPGSLDGFLAACGRDPGGDPALREEYTAESAANAMLAHTNLLGVIRELPPDIYDYIKRRFHVLEPSMFADDPYYANIRLPEAPSGGFALTHNAFEACEIFTCDLPRERLPWNAGMAEMGIFTERFEYPAIMEKGRTWMSVTPNEITTVRPHIEAARRRVLALGLGMGYYAYMAALKPEVESVTTVEISPDVIALFEAHILPQFPEYARRKVRIVRNDAFRYISRLRDGEFDACFADVWLGQEDGAEAYLRLKRMARKFGHMSISYWIEDSILDHLAGMACALVMKKLNRMLGLGVPPVSVTPREAALLDFMDRLLEKERVDTAVDLERLVSPQNIGALLSKNFPEFIPAAGR